MKNLIRTVALLASLAAPTAPAFAGTVVRVGLPAVHLVAPPVRVNVGFDAWNPRAVPVARPGYVWVPGHYDRYGYWNPGYYRPNEYRAGYVYEAGYWNGGVYIEGYWRPERVERQHWVPAHYTRYRGYVPGHWSR